ncbi:dihydrofolate reductase [Cryobacterium sp. CG_9.6]|uniref:dihydrofolate reductase n=1 Tax=Cryobacterium sp. CG_9.6 TaxID=2760710 RepID=UPI0024764836|nr:dihydrofolate reductase [Cryobacterium sp. CG_9.6]MDH6237454.1 dihydrofolate reductase [Cryobacterium sp. CG_9.6]
MLTLVWAQSRNGIIGRDGVLPWHLPEDLAHFAALTRGGAVLMGRRTWDSLPARFRPLPDRLNIVLTRTAGWRAEGASVAHSAQAALELASGHTLWVIGGREVFNLVLPQVTRLEVTEINADIAGDTEAPPLDSMWSTESADPATGWHTSSTGLEYRFVRYTRASTES